MSNITTLDTKPDDVKGLLERVKRGMEDQIELEELLAKLSRAKFLALVKEGFTEAQALAIVIGPSR